MVLGVRVTVVHVPELDTKPRRVIVHLVVLLRIPKRKPVIIAKVRLIGVQNGTTEIVGGPNIEKNVKRELTV